MYTRVIVALDGSDRAEAALPLVRRIVEKTGAEAVLVRVVDVSPVIVSPAGGPPHPLAGVADEHAIEEVRKAATTQLDAIVGRWASDRLKARSVVEVGTPAEVLLELAGEAPETTLLAITSHGRSGLSRFVFGSTAEKVMRACPCALLLWRSFAENAAEADAIPRKLLVPTDGSERSLAVLPHVIAFATLFEAQVELLISLLAPAEQLPDDVVDQVLRAAIEQLEAAGVQVVPVLRRGEPASTIIDESAQRGSDLIAMATHGRSGMRRWVFGSVTEKVLRHANAPMLVVRADAD